MCCGNDVVFLMYFCVSSGFPPIKISTDICSLLFFNNADYC